jgi:mannan endo-1,4-beta-mannosidase
LRQGFAAAAVAIFIATVLGTAGGVGAQSATFVTRDGTQLLLDGEPYRFSGINIYNANNLSGCWYTLGSGPQLGESLDELGAGAKVIRAWFFQALATNGGARDWSGIEHTLTQARARGIRIIATLGNQWEHCDGPNGGAGSFKDEAWYTGGYAEPDPAGTTSYRDWVGEIVERYKDEPTILAWQLLNEAEVKPSQAATSCSVGAAQILKDFATDVSGLVKSIDPNHLVSLGTIGGGQCGAQDTEYEDVHDVATIDLCEYHDYGSPTVEIPGDQWNGLQRRLDQCNALGKPLFVGEMGVDPDDLPQNHQPWFPLYERAHALEKKLRGQFEAGVVGELLWAWNANGSTEDNFDIGPGDPILPLLTLANSPSPGTIERVSVAQDGTPANARSTRPHFSSDGRYVVFSSEATNLGPDVDPHPSCGGLHTFLKDRVTGEVELISVDSNEIPLDGFCGNVGFGISDDGRFVLFQTDEYRSTSGQFVGEDILVRDRVAGTTRNLTAAANGNRNSNGFLTHNGRYAIFTSDASNLVAGTAACPFHLRMYIVDLTTDAIELASADDPGGQCLGNGANVAEVSEDGRWVTFQTDAALVPEDASQRGLDVYLRDMASDDVTLVSTEQDGTGAYGFDPTISADGRVVAYGSDNPRIVPGDTNGPGGRQRGYDVFVYDRNSGSNERVSVDSDGHELEESFRPSVSAGGRFVTFSSGIPSQQQGRIVHDLLVHDRITGRTERVVGAAGIGGGGFAEVPRISPDGRFVAFASGGAHYVSGDTGAVQDVFIHERSGPRDAGGGGDPPPPPAERRLTDRPDEIAGKQIHVMYVLPSDGEDRELDLDGTLQHSVASFQRWLAEQTGGRSLRLDTDGGELDVTFFRMSRTDEDVAATGAFVRDAIEQEIEAAGFDHPSKLYAVYYDGTSTFACGGGAFPPTLPGSVGAMYLNGLPDGPVPCSTNPFAPEGGEPGYMEYAMLHELVHTLGFVPACAPNNNRVSHTGTPPNDLMYAGDDPWDLNGVVLDEDNDDYYGHDALDCIDLEDTPFLTSTFEDGDADGLSNLVDVGDGAFDDGAGTAGELLDTDDLWTTVDDEPSPDGVRIRVASGSGSVELEACGFPVTLTPGTEVVITCGSIGVEVVTGSATVGLGDLAVVALPQGAVARIAQTGDARYSVENLGNVAIAVVIGGVTTPLAPGASLTVAVDTTPPVITPNVTGTVGTNGWYRSDVGVEWTVADPESAVTATAGCGPQTLSTDTAGVMLTCTATSTGGTNASTVAIKRDASPPTIAYSGNAGTYPVDATVAIVCSASDAPSGLASTTCANIAGPAHTFPVGSNSFSSTATDKAGNSRSASTTFIVTVSPGSLCRLTKRFVQTSPRYLALPPSLRAIADQLATVACQKLDAIVPGLKPAQKAALINAYNAGVTALVSAGWLTPAQGTTLKSLAGKL